MKNSRLQPLEAAKRFIAGHFPDCQAALMAGSVVKVEDTSIHQIWTSLFLMTR